MGASKWVQAVGVVDGANTVFTTPGGEAYQPGTMIHALNGQPKVPSDDDGLVETSPATGVVTLKEAPQSIGLYPDTVLLFYCDTSDPGVESVESITGRIVSTAVSGTLADAAALAGRLNGVCVVRGVLATAAALDGSLRASQLTGTITVCS